MKNRMKSMLRKNTTVYQMVRFTKERLVDMRALLAFLAERRTFCKNGTIRVGFLCQFIPAWPRVEGLYSLMKEDPRFEPYILCVPSDITNHKLNDPQNLNNDTYAYFVGQGYTDAVNVCTGEKQWLDLRSLGLSYIFYPRPYNSFMPVCYTTREISKFCRVCLIMYGIEFSEEISKITLNRDFMSHVYFYFAELPFMQNINVKNNWILHKLGFQKTLCLGYPAFERMERFKSSESLSWNFSQNSFRVLWTPRWTTDPAVGGTNFFLYYKKILEFAEEHSDVDFLLRPHPLAFSNFVKMGDMTEEEVEIYKQKCETLSNVSLDNEPIYEATFWGSSVLVSDISSIMPEFFFTGKPLIFCASNMMLELAEPVLQMLEGCYIVNNSEELFACLDMLRRGEDPMKQQRSQVREKFFGYFDHNVSENILNEIFADYSER